MVKLLENSRDIAVLGAGATGQSILRFLDLQVNKVSVFDSTSTIKKQTNIQALFPNVLSFFDHFKLDELRAVDLVVVSPGVDLRQPVLRQLAEEGTFLCSDIEIFCQHAAAPIIAITGSNGKTTVATLVAQALELAGKQVLLGGNIGTPALDLLAQPTPDYYVLELSSYQLESTYSLQNHVAVLLNVTPDHMDRYDSYQSYIAAKRNVYRNAAVAIANADESNEVIGAIKCANQLLFSLQGEGGVAIQRGQVVFDGVPLFSVKEWALQGRHHWQNGLALLAVLKAVDIDLAVGHQVLSTFTGIKHRCQKVHSVNQVSWYDDSKATNEGATIAALRTLSQQCRGRIILIAGGDGKGSDFQLLRPVVAELVDEMILLGQDASLMARAFAASVNVRLVDSMASAVKAAWHLAKEQDVVLLSPACSSLDMFTNFEHRGQVFRQCVEEIVC